jgi:hypothetical protein
MANFFITWKKVIISPKLFFENMPKSGSIGEPLKFALISYIIGGLGVFLSLFLNGTDNIAGLISSMSFSILLLIIGVLSLFIMSFIFWVFFKIVGGKGNYEGTFRQISYSNAAAVYMVIPILLLYSIYLMIIGGKYVHRVSNVRSTIAVLLTSVLVGGIVFFSIIAPAMVFTDFQQPPPPMVSVKVLSASPTSIELRHYGGDTLRLSDMQFTVKKADGEILRPSIVNSSDRFSVGDIIRLSGAEFGNIGDNIEIYAEYKNAYSDSSKVEILKTRTQIQN